MITNTGKNILAKYLVGQTPAYASYMAFGCGATPVKNTDPLGDYSNKTALDFEMFRVPIISRGFVNENGISKIVFTAELPTNDRYEITEVGVFSAKSNSLTTNNDSRTLYSFANGENWQYISGLTATELEETLVSLSNPINRDAPFRTNANNSSLQTAERKSKKEPARFLNDVILVPGNMSLISDSSVSGNYIQLSGISVDLSKNSPSDEIKIAFSIAGNANDNASSYTGKIVVEFTGNDPEIYARMNVSKALSPTTTGRYAVDTKKISDLTYSSGFSWKAVNKVKIYGAVYDGISNTSDAYIVLDAMRIENVSTVNPLYGLTGYTVVKSSDSSNLGIIKEPNSSGFVEFRFAVDVA